MNEVLCRETAMPADDAQARRCDVSVVICTVNRPTLMPKAVATVAQQDNRLGLDYEIVVVDNSRDGASRELVEKIARAHSVPVRYVNEPRMSFAHARNAGVQAARGELIAFFDDDQEASPAWLCSLVETLRQFDADMAFGPLFPVFEGGHPPSWDSEGKYYTRTYDKPSGTTVMGKSTGNMIMRRSSCVVEPEPFAHAYGASGGEDIDFFLRMHNRGAKMVWAAEAVATELQPKETLTLSYRSFRNFSLNQTYVRVEVRNSGNRLATALELMATGAVQVGIYLIPGLAGFLLPPTASLVHARLKLCNGLGKLLWMIPSRLYAKRYR